VYTYPTDIERHDSQIAKSLPTPGYWAVVRGRSYWGPASIWFVRLYTKWITRISFPSHHGSTVHAASLTGGDEAPEEWTAEAINTRAQSVRRTDARNPPAPHAENTLRRGRRGMEISETFGDCGLAWQVRPMRRTESEAGFRLAASKIL